MVVVTEGAKEAIKGMEKDAAHCGAAVRIALDNSQVVVNVDIELGQDPSRSMEVDECGIGLGRNGKGG